MFIIFMNDDPAVPDTAIADSTKSDSLIAYEIPEVVNFSEYTTKGLNQILHTTHDITVVNQDFNLGDLFYLTPFMLNIYGDHQLASIGQKGQDPKHTKIFFNGHPLNNYLLGYFDLTTLPSQFFENIEISQNIMGAAFNGINFITKVNRFDKPFSYINYTTGDFGTNIYNVDFTRPITNDFGFYLSGLYWGSAGYQTYSDLKINSLYTNFYYNQFIPMRLDLVYLSNDFGFSRHTPDTLNGHGNNQFIDFCLTGGLNSNRISLYHTSYEISYRDSLLASSLIKNYGFSATGWYNRKNLDLTYGFQGEISKIEDGLYGTHTIQSIGLWEELTKESKNFFFSVASLGNWISHYKLFYTPKVVVGINIFDSTYLTASIARGFTIPSIIETHEVSGTSDSYLPLPFFEDIIKGNRDLQSEDYWRQGIALKRKNCFLNFYKYDFHNLITTRAYEDYYIFDNLDSWQTMGIENYLELPLYINYQDDGKSTTRVAVSFNNNYLFKGDSLPLAPKVISCLALAMTRQTERFGLDLVVRERYVGARHDRSGQDLPSCAIWSIAGSIRLIAILCTLKIDNLLDKTYAYIPGQSMEPRNFALSIKWDFWD